MLDLVCAGESFDDFVFHNLPRLPADGEELKTDAFVRTSGGGVVITSIAATRLGLRCAAIGGFSAETQTALRREHVQTTNLRRASEPPALTVALSTTRDRRFVTFPGMNDRLPSRLRRVIPSVRARHVHLALFPPVCRPWMAILDGLRRRGIGTSWDFGWNPPLARDPHFTRLLAMLDYVFVNRAEALLYSRTRSLTRALEWWRTLSTTVVLKLGAAGCRLVGSGRDIRVPGTRVRVVDTTGAGDAFNAGFLAETLRGSSLRGALALGNRIGAMSTRRAGGLAGLPRQRRRGEPR